MMYTSELLAKMWGTVGDDCAQRFLGVQGLLHEQVVDGITIFMMLT